jgi:hypothetical protein
MELSSHRKLRAGGGREEEERGRSGERDRGNESERNKMEERGSSCLFFLYLYIVLVVVAALYILDVEHMGEERGKEARERGENCLARKRM